VGLIATPEPWTTGDFDRGLRILSGKIVFTGHMMDIGESSIWNHKPPSPLFAAELHGFRWLDDLATMAMPAPWVPPKLGFWIG